MSESSEAQARASVSAAADGRIVVRGCLDVNTVGSCRDEGAALFPEAEGEALVFDLSASEPRGSAAIALLIAWQREARARSQKMTVVGAPASLLGIAEACGVREIIPFDEAVRE